jgi:RNA polymerase sigma factor (sigma-70 family)
MGSWRLRRSPIVRARDRPEAFEVVFATYWEVVLRFMTRRTFDAEVALDLTAETFTTMLANREQFRGETEEEGRAWMWAIARSQLSKWHESGHVANRHRHRFAVDAGTAAADELDRIEDLAAIAPLRRVVRDALEGLPAGPRTILDLRVVEEWSYDEIAVKLGITTNAARIRVARALALLEDAVASAGGDAPTPEGTELMT